MNEPAPPVTYTSKLRARQKEQTGALILEAVGRILAQADLGAVTIAEVARLAEVTERTVYRHFPTREELLRAFWRWHLERAGGERVTDPHTLDALMDAIRRLFTRLDAEEGVIRAVLSAAEGREIRAATNRHRLEHMIGFLAGLLPELPERDRNRLAVGIVSVSSVHSWMFIRDNYGVDGREAGEAAALSVQMMIQGAQMRASPGTGG